jgi:hypothetical protein
MNSGFGRIPKLDETIFFKSSRFLTKEIAKEINWTLEYDWINNHMS